jgi:hypothetical protein
MLVPAASANLSKVGRGRVHVGPVAPAGAKVSVPRANRSHTAVVATEGEPTCATIVCSIQ